VWSNNGGTNTIVPFGPIAGPQSGFPTDGTKWCIVDSSGSDGWFLQPPGGPALLPYAAGDTGQIKTPTYVPIPGPGQTVRLFFDYTYVSMEFDPFYNDCLSVDLTNGGVSVLNLLYLDTSSWLVPPVSPNASGSIPACFGSFPREMFPAGTAKRISVVIPAALYGTFPEFEVNVANGGDPDCDSYAYIDNIGYCIGGGTVTTLGTGCGTTTPLLVSTVPHFGQTFTLSVSQAPAATSGLVFFGAPALNPIALGSGCNVFIDLATLVQWLPFATDASGGPWSTSFMLPNTPTLIGAEVALQAALFPTAAPLGIDITNGLLETFGNLCP
jgi:hypothetical protein